MEESTSGFLAKLLSRGAFSQQEMETACHWSKQVVAVAHGVACGLLPLTGMNAIFWFVVLTLVTSWLTYSLLLRADLELIGVEGQLELVKEGLPPAVATFFLTWILVFTFAQPHA